MEIQGDSNFMQEKDLTIILVTFNSDAIIAKCLKTIYQKYPIIIVDNNSIDNSCQIIAKEFPLVKLIKLQQNLGFSRANNIALQQIKTNFALLLNADAFINNKDIDKILEIMSANQQIAIAGSTVYACQINDNGQIFNQTTIVKKDRKEGKYQEDDQCVYNKFITGAAMFLNMNIMKKIGFFDEGFFLYCEDNEICKRVIKNGYKTAVIKGTKLLHLSGKSCKITDEQQRMIYWHRFGWSKLYYTQKIWGTTVARLKAISMILKLSAKILLQNIKNQPLNAINTQALKGCLAFFIGLKSFDKNNNPRG